MTRPPAPAPPVRHDDVAPHDVAPHDIAPHDIAPHGLRRLLSAGVLDLPPSPLRAEWRVDRDADHCAGATETGRATGPGPLVTDAAHARHVADLQVYVRQSHGDRDPAAIGRRVVAGADA